MTQYQSRPGFTVVDGLPPSTGIWTMRQLGHETIIAISEGHGAYLIANGKAEKITPLPGPHEPVMIKTDRLISLDGYAETLA